MDDVASNCELRSKEAYEPPRLDELGKVEELTEVVAGSVVDDTTTT